MADYERHFTQATHNEKLLNVIIKRHQSEFSDWHVTIAFYSAVHYFEALLFKSKKSYNVGSLKIAIDHSSDLLSYLQSKSEHYVRKHLMLNNLAVFDKIYNPFITLYENSRTARYNCNDPQSHDTLEAEKALDTIKTECAALLPKKKK